MRLEPVIGDDPRDILRALKSALHGAGPGARAGRRRARCPARCGRNRGGRHDLRLDRHPEERRPEPRCAHGERARHRRPRRRGRLAARPAGELCRGHAGARPVDRRRPRARDPERLVHAAVVRRGGAHDGLDRARHAHPDVHLARAGAAHEAAGLPPKRTRRCWRRCARSRRSSSAARRFLRSALERAESAGARDRPHVRLDRDERRMRLRRRAAARGVGPDRRRRGADRGADARRGLPRRSRDDGCRLPAHSAMARGGT